MSSAHIRATPADVVASVEPSPLNAMSSTTSPLPGRTTYNVTAARVDTPIFAYEFWMWRSAVLTEIPSGRAICLVRNPRASRRITSVSRRRFGDRSPGALRAASRSACCATRIRGADRSQGRWPGIAPDQFGGTDAIHADQRSPDR
jgi:hypothetical protein